MSVRIECPTSERLALGDFIAHVEANVRRDDPQSIASAAPLLRAVSNAPDLVLPALHQQIRERFSTRPISSTQIIALGGGSDFYVRADLWPSSAMLASPAHRDQAALYRVANDLNYPSLVTWYYGSPLEHDVYSYDPASIVGVSGELVPLTFKERISLDSRCALLTLPQQAVVRRHAPTAYTVTIGLMIKRTTGEVHTFDIESGTLMRPTPDQTSSRCSALFQIAALIGDDTTRQHLDDVSIAAISPRTRLAAYEALIELTPNDSTRLWEKAARDDSALIQRRARGALESQET
jgi:hypothetical protein